MGVKHNKKSKNNNNNNNIDESFEEQKLFESFQEKKFTSEITAITYFKMNPEDIIINEIKENKEHNHINLAENSLDLTEEISLSNKSLPKVKKDIYLDISEINNKLFIFLINIDNIVNIIDSHSFQKLFKFREDSKTEKRKCKIMTQSEIYKSLLLCIHENKLNINKIKIINSNKSSIYCEQIQSIEFGKDYVTIYDLKEINSGELIIGLEGCFFIWNKTNKGEDINMTYLEERKLLDKILNENNFPGDRQNLTINIKGNHHYLPYEAIYLKNINIKTNKKLILHKNSIKNILQLNNCLFTILINLNANYSVLRFYHIYDKKTIFDEKDDIIINDIEYKMIYITKLFYITEKYFGLLNLEKLIIISSKYKQIVSIFLINDIKSFLNTKHNNKINIFIPKCFLLFPNYYFLVEFIDMKKQNVYLKMFRFIISKSNFVEIFNVSRKKINDDDLIYNILPFKNVKDHKQSNINFAAEFFITNNKNNIVKKWIITNYEKE